MASKFFIDTNILVYAHDLQAGIKQKKAAQILEKIWQKRNGVLSIQVLQEFYVTLTQKIPKQFKSKDAKFLLGKYGHWQIVIPQVNHILEAIDFQKKHHLSFWDALIVRAALEGECEFLLTEDMQHNYRIRHLTIQNPFFD